MCALFGGERDIALFRSINKELINDIIQSEVDVYQQSIDHTSVDDLYGETEVKAWLLPVRLACIIKPEDQESEHGDLNLQDKKQIIRFAFLRDELRERKLEIWEGNIIHWNNRYWEVDNIIENKLHLARNPDTNKTIGKSWGWDVSIICQAYMTKMTLPELEKVRFGGYRYGG